MAESAREIPSTKTSKVYRVIEFYSGIGGMHFAAQACGFKTDVVAALEINTTANAVYKYNFPEVPLLQCNIEGLTVKDLEKLSADIFVMSPPCQPFTRVGLKGASSDPRTKSFLHILDLILRISKPPDYILMENVKGFETSDTREHFVKTLHQAGYCYQEFLVSPNQFGIPNSRLRYYMLAKRKPLHFYFHVQDKILDYIPQINEQTDNNCESTSTSRRENGIIQDTELSLQKTEHHCCNDENQSHQECHGVPSNSLQSSTEKHTHQTTESFGHDRHEYVPTKCNVLRTLSEFLETGDEGYFSQFLLPEKVLSRFALVLDIVTPSSTHSCCFTKAYGHYAEGTGSVLKMAEIDDTEPFNKYRSLKSDTPDCERAAVLSDLKLRYFTPREVTNIMCFPKSFGFPVGTSIKQQYRLLGNSLNVHVVTELLKCLLNDE